MNRRTAIIVVALVLVLAGIGVAAWQLFLKPQSSIPAVALTVVGADGSSKIVTQTDLAALSVIANKGGLKTSAGSIQSIGTYTGVSLSDVLKLVGGATSANSVRITASDNYAMVYTWDQLSGKYVTYDGATGNEVQATKSLIPVLAYMVDGKPLASGEGPMRLVILGDEGLITDGHFWIKMVSKIEVMPAVQEYTLTLTGATNFAMNRSTLESGISCNTPHHKSSWTDSSGNIWTGMPLWLLMGYVDDKTAMGYNDTLAKANAYTVKLSSPDGYSVTLNSTFVNRNDNIIVANMMNGKPLNAPYWPLRIVGSAVTKKQMIRNLSQIQLVFGSTTKPTSSSGDAAIIANATWTLHLHGKMSEPIDAKTLIQYTLASPGGGSSWTDTSGNVWVGIPLWSLVGRVDDNQPSGFNSTLADSGYTVRVKASDGYSADFTSASIKMNNNIILAYKMNEKALPSGSAPLETVGSAITKKQMVKSVVEIDLIFPG